MRFAHDIVIPADTPLDAPHVETVTLDIGTLAGISVRFLAGCHNRVYVAIFEGIRQIAPAHETAALYGNDVIFSIPMSHVLDHKPYALIVKGWSPGARYDHTISLWFDIHDLQADKRASGLAGLMHLLGGS